MTDLQDKLTNLLDKVDAAVSNNVPELTQEYVQYIATEASLIITALWVWIAFLVTTIFLTAMGAQRSYRKGNEDYSGALTFACVACSFVFLVTCWIALATAPDLYAQYYHPVGYAVDKALNE